MILSSSIASDFVLTQTLPVDGYALAAAREPGLAIRTQQLKAVGLQPAILAILFQEDQGSVLYTRLKQEAAARLGIKYQVSQFSINTPLPEVLSAIQQANTDPEITGIIIQKPSRGQRDKAEYQAWWQPLIAAIDPRKDVDGLTPRTLELVRQNQWQQSGAVLPATCRAVLTVLQHYTQVLSQPAVRGLRFAVIGKSELLGLPLAAELTNLGCNVTLLGKKDLNQLIEQGIYLRDFDVVVTATGQPAYLKGDWLKQGSVVVDVGEPKGDVEAVTARPVAALLSPVPGGVGPLTVSCLMENSLDLLEPR